MKTAPVWGVFGLQNCHSQRRLGQAPKNCGSLQNFTRVSRYEKTPQTPQTPKLWQTFMGEMLSKRKAETVANRGNCHSLGSLPVLETATVSQKDSPDCHSFSKKTPKTATVSKNCPSLRNCPSLGSFSGKLSQSGEFQEPGSGITRSTRTKKSIVSQGKLHKLSQSWSFGSFVSTNWGSFGNWGSFKELGQFGESGEFQHKVQNVTKPLV